MSKKGMMNRSSHAAIASNSFDLQLRNHYNENDEEGLPISTNSLLE